MQIFVCVLNTLLRIVGLLIIYLLLDASPSCKFQMYIRIFVFVFIFVHIYCFRFSSLPYISNLI